MRFNAIVLMTSVIDAVNHLGVRSLDLKDSPNFGINHTRTDLAVPFKNELFKTKYILIIRSGCGCSGGQTVTQETLPTEPPEPPMTGPPPETTGPPEPPEPTEPPRAEQTRPENDNGVATQRPRPKKRRLQRRRRKRKRNGKVLTKRRRINYINMMQRRQTRLQALMRMYFWRIPIQIRAQPLIFTL